MLYFTVLVTYFPSSPHAILIVSDYTSAATTLVTSVFVFISALLAISMINMYDSSCRFNLAESNLVVFQGCQRWICFVFMQRFTKTLFFGRNIIVGLC